MPRPGPRPYECVRRAWHSDRHGPIRGSLIQQIFRVVNEAHAAETKKNKEWQEKLPVVVLKTEQIMYSKANSETEYSNLETLWERVNDAINTIIRREETTETGDLLPPCVEAALNLGCVPVRASRSQRHINPRTYLTPGPRPQEPPNLPSRVTERTVEERRPQNLPFHPGSQPSSFARTPVGNSPNFHPSGPNSNYVRPVISPEKSSSVYPLYYGARFANDEHRVPRETTRPERIYVGKPVGTEPTTRPVYFACPDARENPLPPPREPECDLSLRLGTSSELPRRRSDKSLARGTDDGDDDYHDTRRFTTRGKEFCFFPGKEAGDDSFEGPSSKGKKPFRGVSSDWFNT